MEFHTQKQKQSLTNDLCWDFTIFRFFKMTPGYIWVIVRKSLWIWDSSESDFFHFIQVTHLLMSFTPYILVPVEVRLQIPYPCTSCCIKRIQCTGVLKQFWFLCSSNCCNSAHEGIHEVKLNLCVLFWKATVVVWLCKKTY